MIVVKRKKKFFTGYMVKIWIYIQDDWEGRCLFSNKNTASAGVMILFNTNFEYKLENVITDSDGRYLICTIVVINEQIVLGNYYGLNSDELYLCLSISSDINEWSLLNP
jgi:hypothetical protein